MTDSLMRVFVNEQPVELPRPGLAHHAVAAASPDLARHLMAGTAYLTDGRGIRLDPDVPVGPGAILRVVIPAHRETHADA